MKIKQLRERAKLTQTEFAEKLGVTQACVAMWETGKAIPKSSLLLNISKTLNCTVDDILR